MAFWNARLGLIAASRESDTSGMRTPPPPPSPPPVPCRLASVPDWFEVLPAPALVLEDGGGIAAANGAARGLLGALLDELTCLDELRAKLMKPDGSAMAFEDWPPACGGRFSKRLGLDRPGAGALWLDVEAAPLPQGGILAMLTDRTIQHGLERDEALFRTLLEGCPTALALVRDSCFLYLNPAALRLFGAASPSELVGRSILDRIPPEDRAGMAERIRRARQERTATGDLQHRLLRMDGHAVEAETIGVPVVCDGQPAFLVFASDVSARTVAQAGLAASEANYRALLEAMPDYVFVLSREGRFLSAHAAPDGALYLPSEAALGRSVLDLFPGELGGRTLAALGRACGEGRLQILNYELPYPGGTLHFEGRMVPISSEAALLVSRDVTARVEAEQALRASESLLQRITEHAPDVIAKLDPDGCIRYVNRLLPGYSRSDVIGRNWLMGLHEDDRARAQEAFSQALATLQPAEFEAQAPLQADGPVHYHCRISPVVEGEKTLSLVLFATDVTERKRLAEQRRELELQFQHAQKMESLGLLAGGVAHDMNNVLGAILGLATAGRQGQDPDSPLAKSLETITRACDRGRSLVRSLLDFARKDLAEEKVLDLNALLRDEVQILERTTLQRVQLRMDLDPDLNRILGDPGALSHAIMNLCLNAVDAMPQGGTLTLRSRNLGPEQVRIEVEDSGSGMSDELLKKVLDPFFTTKPQGQGTGLGLSIAYGTVQAHRGQMRIQSRPGEGTKVLLTFPVSQREADDAVPGPEAPAPAADQEFLILVVDDDELVRCSMEILLDALAMRAAMASSGEEALGMLEAGLRPDLVILDVNMPGMGGTGFLPRFRERFADVPVLVVTGRVDQAALDLVKAHAGVEIFPKPFAFDELNVRLKAIAERKAKSD